MTDPQPVSKPNGNCLGCGTYVPVGETHCATCAEKQGQTPQYLVNLNAGKRPPYERPSAINSE